MDKRWLTSYYRGLGYSEEKIKRVIAVSVEHERIKREEIDRDKVRGGE